MKCRSRSPFRQLPQFSNRSPVEIIAAGDNLRRKHALDVIAGERGFSSFAAQGGYLFSYRDQYFICESGFIEALGPDANDPNWQKIGWNCLQPADALAWERLLTSLQAV
jgi:hypothetical protein